ncbi:alkaline phosphatase D family protein [Rhodopirellula sp. JC740]|uniref:Alkaline phosphatase D family protein n=1 Tax=Rhodopirellula halodulae TaxID=2894198 RepID=A0ABS8NIJ0_9BACT|nr:alkaline phosphatase D family protein [Rhodopirellula sp. JC740]MCC9643377.1 alkaline phosphatase D family protein [Rhodopirellula sp. JC740]
MSLNCPKKPTRHLELNRREAITWGAVAAPLLIGNQPRANADESPGAPVGPMLGHVDHETAIIWYRPGVAGEYTVTITNRQNQSTQSATATASPTNDLCIKWQFDGLEADTDHTYVISTREQTISESPAQSFRTAPPTDRAAKTVLAMGSCASSTEFFDIWTRIASTNPDGLMLLGDTPYIDNSELAINRKRHREFLSIPTLALLGASTPIWGTWDDHDFGGNDTDGKVSNKHLIRQAFTEYRAQKQFGDGEHGVYTKFRRGPVEVFMIDPRYFSQTERSPVADDKPTCLGKNQWQWLCDGLKESTASFKLLATGMIWDDKQNKEKDDWQTYAHEREAIFDFIGEHEIGGVVLIGGDIHVSRHLKYPMKQRIGYDLHQFIISPLHDRVIPSLNVPHPDLQWGEPIKNMFLVVTADTTGHHPTLDAKWIDRMGTVHHRARIELGPH